MPSESPVTFTAEILQHKDMDAAYVEFPFDVNEVFGARGNVRVKALFDDLVEYRGSLTKMGGNCHCLGVTKAIRKELSKTFGDEIKVELWKDTEERMVNVPDDVKSLFAFNEEAMQLFDKMSYTHRKEYINWIEEAKKPETRERRKQKMIEMILLGKKGI